MRLPQKYLDPLLLARLQGLQLRARSIVEGHVAGAHRSPFRGLSIEFADHREYSPGDDLRYLDWKALARTDRLCLKRFEEETNLVCHLLLDTSESMAYRSAGASASKLDYAKQAAAALAYVVLQQQDSVGLAAFDHEIRAFVRPAGNPSHIQPLLQAMDRSHGERKTASGPIFHELAERFKKRGVVVVLSDFFDDVDAMMAGLKHFRCRQHDVALLHVLDPAEIEFPFDEPTLFHGLEQLPDALVEPRALRAAYLAEFNRFVSHLRRACRMHQIDYVLARTDRPLDALLSSFLASRR